MGWPLIAASLLLLVAAAEYSGMLNGVQEDAAAVVADVVDSVQSEVDNMMINVFGAVEYQNVRAFLAMIRVGEGTRDENGYRRIYGGRLFDSFADHPRIKVTAGGWTSTAAGAYQFKSSTWDECRAALDLPDFSPASQDVAAVWLIRRRGALADVIAGRFDRAVQKCNREWASLPGSPYGQPTVSIESARFNYQKAGGVIA